MVSMISVTVHGVVVLQVVTLAWSYSLAVRALRLAGCSTKAVGSLPTVASSMSSLLVVMLGAVRCLSAVSYVCSGLWLSACVALLRMGGMVVIVAWAVLTDPGKNSMVHVKVKVNIARQVTGMIVRAKKISDRFMMMVGSVRLAHEIDLTACIEWAWQCVVRTFIGRVSSMVRIVLVAEIVVDDRAVASNLVGLRGDSTFVVTSRTNDINGMLRVRMVKLLS